MAKVLLVEDNFILQKMYAEKFRKEGFEVILASNGRECIDKAISNQPEFILLDLKLPGIEGGEALRYLKNHDKTKDIPVVVFTELEDEPEETIKDPQLIQSLAAYWKKSQFTPRQIVDNVKKILQDKSNHE